MTENVLQRSGNAVLRWSFWIDQFFKVSVLLPSLYLQVPSFLALKQTVARAISNSGVVPEEVFRLNKHKVLNAEIISPTSKG